MSDVHQEHVQGALFAPTAVEVVLRCGIVREADHGQFQVEVRSASDGRLIDMWALPHCSLTKIMENLERAVDEMGHAITYWAVPFP